MIRAYGIDLGGNTAKAVIREPKQELQLSPAEVQEVKDRKENRIKEEKAAEAEVVATLTNAREALAVKERDKILDSDEQGRLKNAGLLAGGTSAA